MLNQKRMIQMNLYTKRFTDTERKFMVSKRIRDRLSLMMDKGEG